MPAIHRPKRYLVTLLGLIRLAKAHATIVPEAWTCNNMYRRAETRGNRVCNHFVTFEQARTIVTGQVPSRPNSRVNLDYTTFAIASSALASFVLAKVLVLTADRHGRFTMDLPGAVQKFHSNPTPRIGGIGIYLALIVAWRFVPERDAAGVLATILLAGIPALLIGLIEDLTKRVGVGIRLIATMASGALACWLGGTSLTHVDWSMADSLLRVAPIAMIFTAFAVGGVSNAINIIDGFHGLASGTAVLCLLALACIAARVGDSALVLTTVVVAAAIAGFWMVNFPWGKLFLGDGGAYFAGFALAWLAVLLPMRNPAVSPWASLLVCAYPIVEVMYSIVRRLYGRHSAGEPDRRHLHSLVATQVIPKLLPELHPTLQNSSVSVIMWLCAAVPALAAIAFHHSTGGLVLCAAAVVVTYHLIYRRVART
jgi:UDP-N-acetylmuramyl pentapeptide phosphotransferase/UDP-N-acetylglucosamine-1-phosphate transferase